MSFLPIVDRELRVAMRRRLTYWSRVIAASVAVGLTAWMMATLGTVVTPELLGIRLFRLVSSLAFFFCIVAGLVLTADCLSQEKRGGTLGLLFLTPLRGYDVVLGKLVGTSLSAFSALLAIFPVLAVPLVLGGVTVGEFWRVVISLANAMFFSLAAGLCVSAASWQAQYAMLGTGFIVVVVTWVLPTITIWFAPLSPVSALRGGFDSVFKLRPWLFYSSVGLVQATGWSLLGLASWLAPRLWLQERSFTRRTSTPRPGRPHRRGKTSFVIGDRNPVDWLANRGLRQTWIWNSLIMTASAWIIASLAGPGARVIPLACLVGAAVLQLVLQFWIAWEASRRFGDDRGCGMLEMLLVSPLTVPEIVRAQAESLRRQFTWPVLAVLAFHLSLLLVAGAKYRWRGDEFPNFLALMLAGVIWLGVTARGLVWVGMWLGLKSKVSAGAALMALVTIVGVPTGIFMVASYVILMSGPGNLAGPIIAAVLWVMFGGVNAHFATEYARERLLGSFRQVAAGDVEPTLRLPHLGILPSTLDTEAHSQTLTTQWK